MASVAGRKKSGISPGDVQVDIPVGTNTLHTKAASQSTSLHQQCSVLRSRLLRVHGFAHFFALSSPTGSFHSPAEVVNTIWDCFALGTPLCYIFNLLPPPITPIDIETDPRSVDIGNERAKKRAIALFAIHVKQLNHGEPFTVTDLWDRTNPGGFVKVVNIVTHIVDCLPPDVFEEAAPQSPPFSPHDFFDSMGPDIPANGPDAEWNNIIRELVETERKYVQDLEVMQKFAQELSESSTLDGDTIHLLFPNLNNLLNFQRRFSIRLEGTADIPWREQRWGLLFTNNEEEFAVYEPYCANYTNASDVMLMEERSLVKCNHLIDAKSELPAFRIKPVQRICFYPLLLDQLLKKSSPVDYPHYEELKAGSAAAKRITDKIINAQRRAENLQTTQNLIARVDDWKGDHVSKFGELSLDDFFIVTVSEVVREYHVFLFERIILCCKEDTSATGGNNKKVGKGSSLLKKAQVNESLVSGLAGSSKKMMTPLLLKGRIFLNNVVEAKVISSGSHSLNIWWKGDDDLEFLTLHCRSEGQAKQWETAVKGLIEKEKAAMRRASERSTRLAHFSTHSGYPFPRPRDGMTGDRGYSTHLAYDYSVASSISPTSGGSTGVSFDERQGTTTPGLDHYPGYQRPRAHTEDANGAALSQWRGRYSSRPQFSSGYISEPRSRSMLLQGDIDSRSASSFFVLGDGSNSSLNTIGPLSNRENPQLRSYPSSTALQSNGSLRNASFMTSPSYDSLIEVPNDIGMGDPRSFGASDGAEAQKIRHEDALAELSTTSTTIKPQILYAVVLYDFVGERPDELDAKAGDSITVVAHSTRDWFVAKSIVRLGKPGLIPISFVEVRDPATGKPILDRDIGALMDKGALPDVEDWKKQMLNHKVNTIVLGVLDDSAPSPSASHPFTSANISPPTAHPPATAHMASTQPSDEQQLSDRFQTPILPDGLLLSANVVSFHLEMDEYWFRVHVLYQPFGLSRAGSTLPPAKNLVLFRAYNDFFDYQIALLETFPREAGRESGHPRIIPFMPGPADNVNDALSFTRQQELDGHLRRLCYLNRTTARYILEHKLTREFLALKPGDVERDEEPQHERVADVGWYKPSEEPVPVSINNLL